MYNKDYINEPLSQSDRWVIAKQKIVDILSHCGIINPSSLEIVQDVLVDEILREIGYDVLLNKSELFDKTLKDDI